MDGWTDGRTDGRVDVPVYNTGGLLCLVTIEQPAVVLPLADSSAAGFVTTLTAHRASTGGADGVTCKTLGIHFLSFFKHFFLLCINSL